MRGNTGPSQMSMQGGMTGGGGMSFFGNNGGGSRGGWLWQTFRQCIEYIYLS